MMRRVSALFGLGAQFPIRRNENVAIDNLQRMIQLADEFFEVKHDPDQIAVTENVMVRLRSIHPSTMSEARDENGPISWILVIPTTSEVMESFLAGKLNERELLEKTPAGSTYTAIYLCSALVLPEFRGKGIARKLTIDAVQSIMRDHPIKALFSWPFSVAGEKLARSIAEEIGLPIRQRPHA